jgi:hypothetical protein
MDEMAANGSPLCVAKGPMPAFVPMPPLVQFESRRARKEKVKKKKNYAGSKTVYAHNAQSEHAI